MKKITTILALVGTLTLGLAADATIDAQIEEIQNAPAQERVRLMNQFKKQLSAMNKEERGEAIAKMQSKMQESGEMTQARVQERKRARIREAQEDASGEMNRHQNMNQKQIGNQFAKDPSAASSGGNRNFLNK